MYDRNPNSTKKPKRKLRRTTFLLPIILFLAVLAVWYVNPFSDSGETPSNPSVTTSPSDGSLITAPVAVGAIEFEPFLKLVNADYGLSNSDITAFKLKSVYGVVPAATSCIELNPQAMAALRAFFDEAGGLGYSEFYLTSGFRDFERQAELYNAAADRSFVQPAGHSEHHTGLAADISYLSVSTSDFAHSEYGAWFTQNAHRFGFILRYPEGKEHITGISYEPWHFRYVGLPHAAYIAANAVTLEEYITFLKRSGGYDIEWEGVSYRVIYAAPQNGSLELPVNFEYGVSPDNTGGYIITVTGFVVEQSAPEVTPPQSTPVIHGASDITVVAGTTARYREGVTVSDVSDPNPTLEIDSSGVNLAVPGTYTVTYTATNSAGRSSSVTVNVTVISAAENELDELANNRLQLLGVFDTEDTVQRIRLIHQYVYHNMEYVNNESDPDNELQFAHNALRGMRGDCIASQRASEALFDRAGIQHMRINNHDQNPPIRHVWNLVYVDGLWYHYDSTRFLNCKYANSHLFTDQTAQSLNPNRRNVYRFTAVNYPPIA
jgi:D-alanyl-D-alanine carboxypeptidase